MKYHRALLVPLLNRYNDVKYATAIPIANVIPIAAIKKKLVNANRPNPIKLVKNEYNVARVSAAEFVFMWNIA